VIVRLMGEGQFRAPDELATELNEVDNQAVDAVEAGDEARLHELLERMGALVRERGEPLEDADLSASDLIIPPTDLSLEEARELFSGDGLIPDLPE
jgi:PspA-Associated protein